MGCSSQDATSDIPPPTPGLALGVESLPVARGKFASHLTRLGPAPGASIWPVTPRGAVVIRYRSGDLDLQGFASPVAMGLSPDAKRPGLLFLHGGFSLGEAAWGLTRPFQEAGYVVLIPRLRGENGQPGHFSLFLNEVADVLAAAETLAARPDVKPSRLFLAGHSVGGTLTLLTALSSRRFVAAASFSRAPDLVEYLRGRSELIPFDSHNFHEFRVRSPVAFATGFLAPVRLFYGEAEFWLQASTLRTTLLARRANLDVEAVELPGGHDSVTPASVATCLRFFRDQAAKLR